MSKLLVLLGTISLLTPFTLDIYLPALPAIAMDLRASAGAVQLTLPVFFVCLAVSQLLFGSLADHIGRRPPLLWGLALLVAGSVGCALSHGGAALTVWRGMQALGQHVLWGSLLLFLIIYGPGILSLDYLLNRSSWSNQ
jgi:DHA1 family bicyclomycin/chloramphenicol resistance-like MFS transporter